jgi:hypothetical protein
VSVIRFPDRARHRLEACVLAILALGALSAPAVSASVVTVGGARYGVFPSTQTAAANARPADGPTSGGQPPLRYHGGPVDHDLTTHVLYWSPSGHAIPASFTSGFDTFLRDFAASATANSNIASVARQYVDADGPALSGLVSAGSISDTSPYPTSGCSPSAAATICLTDAQVVSELAGQLAARHLPAGLSESYVVVVPSDVQVCLPGGCIATAYCGYHGDLTPGGLAQTAYTVIGVPSGGGCAVSDGPHNDPALDGAVGVEAHELIETATDPQPGLGYEDGVGLEIADLCHVLVGNVTPAASGFYNQVLGGDEYLLPEMWSNQGATCAQSLPSPATVSISAAGGASATTGTFTAALHGDAASASYQWQYLTGPGAIQVEPGSGVSVSIDFPALGSYVVWATATDATGNAIIGAMRVALPLAPPPRASFTYAPAAPLTGSPVTFDASASTCASAPCSYAWSDDGSPSRPSSVLYPLGSGRTLQFAFHGAGVKYVRLVITDASGRSATAEHNVVVSAPPPSPPTTPPPPGQPPSTPPPAAPPGGNPPTSAPTGSGAPSGAAGGTLGSSASGLITPSPAQLNALLATIIVAHGKTAEIGALLRNGGYPIQLSVPGAGRLTVSWYRPGPHGRRILVANATRSLAGSGMVRLLVALTPAGRRLLRSAHRVTLSARARFAASSGAPTATVQAGFTLTR